MTAVEFGLLLRSQGLAPTPEFRFAPPRRWRFDFAWPEHRVAVEVDGGAWTGGRHVHPQGFARDHEKLNAAVMQGWRVLRFTPQMLDEVDAVSMVRQLLSLE